MHKATPPTGTAGERFDSTVCLPCIPLIVLIIQHWGSSRIGLHSSSIALVVNIISVRSSIRSKSCSVLLYDEEDSW
jgi:hypothetical protein